MTKLVAVEEVGCTPALHPRVSGNCVTPADLRRLWATGAPRRTFNIDEEESEREKKTEEAAIPRPHPRPQVRKEPV